MQPVKYSLAELFEGKLVYVVPRLSASVCLES